LTKKCALECGVDSAPSGWQ